MEKIKNEDVEKITDSLNPRALTKCYTNTLYMAMQVDDMMQSPGLEGRGRESGQLQETA